MNSSLPEDLERFGRMAFVRAANCAEAISRFHQLNRATRENPDHDLLRKVYEWVFAPMSVWPVDVRGLCLHLLDCIENGRQVDERARLLCELLSDAPPQAVCEPISEYEHAVKEGSYESLIRAQYKFDSMEAELCENAKFKADWERLKRQFPVDKYRNARGVIRRRRVEERNFRASDWRFSWKTEAERFQVVFDAFCHRWNLYGIEGRKVGSPSPWPSPPGEGTEKLQISNSKEMTKRTPLPDPLPFGRGEGESPAVRETAWEDRPLLLKLTVNLTPYRTIIMVPRYWSFDPKRDLKWGAITKLHRMREVPRQGPKLDPSRAARRDEATRAKELWKEATKGGLKGDRRTQWVMGKLGWDARTDESRLRRLMRQG